MMPVRLQRTPWYLAYFLYVSVATAVITQSNSSTVGDRFSGTLPLRHDGDTQDTAQLVPLTREAAQRTIEGNLYNTNYSNVASIADSEIAYISCNPDDYTGFADAQSVFRTAFSTANISGIILYSTATDYCDYEQDSSQDMQQYFPVYSMTNKEESGALRADIDNLPPHMKYFVQVQGRGNNQQDNQPQQNPLGPSPSTAVAMIILYSITGIITALFLIIIITGAIRAHRHPERYGPRNVLGRPRQSRARGLGRAILDTIPIVKFGEKEPAKPADVEMGSTSEARDVNAVNTENAVQTDATAAKTSTTETTTAATEGSEVPKDATVQEQQEGIAPALPAVAAAASGRDSSTNDESLGCSICTEDFEKGQDLRVLPCDHKFHPECVDPWLLNVSGTCPLCRVDLRPTTSNESSAPQDPDTLAPPLNPEAETSQRRRVAFREILSLRHRPGASAEERITALRRLREQRQNQSGDVAENSANASVEDVGSSARDSRSKRMSARLSDVFSGRSRRERGEEVAAAAASAQTHQGSSDSNRNSVVQYASSQPPQPPPPADTTGPETRQS